MSEEHQKNEFLKYVVAVPDKTTLKFTSPDEDASNRNPGTYTLKFTSPDEDASNRNPGRENTHVLPRLVRRINSSDLVPHPWRSLSCLIVMSYLSVIFCIFTGTASNHFALNARRYHERGLFSLAKKNAKIAAILIYVTAVLFVLLIILIPLLVFFA